MKIAILHSATEETEKGFIKWNSFALKPIASVLTVNPPPQVVAAIPC
jgi:hypothetical protein